MFNHEYRDTKRFDRSPVTWYNLNKSRDSRKIDLADASDYDGEWHASNYLSELIFQ